MIFFDIDNTLLNHSKAMRASALEFHAAHAERLAESPEESPEEFAARWHVVAEKHMRRYFDGEITHEEQRRARLRELFGPDHAIGDAEADEMFELYLDGYRANWSLYPDVLPCLDSLRDRNLGIISNGSGEQQRRKLAGTGIADRFDPIILSGELGVSKPEPGIFMAACEAAGQRPDECVYVGDNLEVDILGGTRAGMEAIWLNRVGDGSVEGIVQIESLGEVKALVGSVI